MSTREQIGMLVLVAGAAASFCAPTLAQDSVGRTPSGAGGAVKDNISAYDAAQTQKAYVVDLVSIPSSWGNQFNVGPIIKSSNGVNTGLVTSAFLNTNTLSAVPIVTQAPSNTQYSLWRGTVGEYFGVNVARIVGGPVNDPAPSTVTRPATTIQLATAFIEGNSTGATGNTRYNGMVGGFINYDPANPLRLYVQRIAGASNNNAPVQSTTSVFGLGGVDADGNVLMRIDGFGADAANPNTLIPVTGQTNNCYLRIDLDQRTPGTLNWIRAIQSPPGTVDATQELSSDAPAGFDVARGILGSGATTFVNANTPTLIPESIAGRPVAIGSAFDTRYRYESAPGVLSDTIDHRGGAATTDHRGSVSYTFRNVFPNSTAGTGAMLAFQVSSIGRPGGDAIAITTWGLDNNGAPVGNYIFTAPDASLGLGMVDPYSLDPNTSLPFDTATGFPFPPGATLPVFMDYQGNTFSTGGNGQSAVFVGQDGELLVAALVSANTPAGNPDPIRADRRNYIAVGRTNLSAPTPTTDWTCAAWISAPLPDTATDSTGKPIVDAAGNPVGRLTTFSDYNNGFPTFGTPPNQTVTQGGPSISEIAFDSVGNIYFIAPARLITDAGERKRLVLVRGVRQSSPFGYKLEKVLAENDVIRGANSGTNYRISGLKLTNVNSSTNVVDNGTIFSSVSTQTPASNLDRATLQAADPRTLGGIVVGASITYDVDDNGSFADSIDQNYQALLFVNGAASSCPRDFNGDGNVDPDDLSDYISCFFNTPPCARADLNGDGNIDPDDLSDYIALFFGACP